jgi:hypothetical protein
MPKQKYPHEGKQVEGTPLTFKSDGEQWCNYTLEDGSTMKIKLVLMDVARLEAFGPNGDPVYFYAAQQVVGITPNPSLKKK